MVIVGRGDMMVSASWEGEREGMEVVFDRFDQGQRFDPGFGIKRGGVWAFGWFGLWMVLDQACGLELY